MASHEHDATLRESDNPYEMIVLAAREAERINAARLAPGDRKPTSVAIERVARGETTKKADAEAAPRSTHDSGDQEPTPAA